MVPTGMMLLTTEPKVPPWEKAAMPRKMKAKRRRRMMVRRRKRRMRLGVESPSMLRALSAVLFWTYLTAWSNSNN